jgi:hypothetical protein
MPIGSMGVNKTRGCKNPLLKTITKNNNNMKKAINNFKQQDTAVKIGITFVVTFIIPMLIFIAVNIASGNVSNF